MGIQVTTVLVINPGDLSDAGNIQVYFVQVWVSMHLAGEGVTLVTSLSLGAARLAHLEETKLYLVTLASFRPPAWQPFCTAGSGHSDIQTCTGFRMYDR